MVKVGLTGSIATGKTFVAGCIRDLGCHVLDADVTAREVVAKGTDGLAEVVNAFGSVVLLENGEIDRAKLGRIVFSDSSKRKLLNSIVHPRVIKAQNEWLDRLHNKTGQQIAVIEAALMIESGNYKRFDKLIVTWCKPAIQLKRLMLRDGLCESEAMARISAQMPQNEKKRLADYLIDTSLGFEDTRQKTRLVYLELKRKLDGAPNS